MSIVMPGDERLACRLFFFEERVPMGDQDDSTRDFTVMPIPGTATGSGDRAYPVDYNRSGFTSFLVLNGEVPFTGPLQLLTPQPS